MNYTELKQAIQDYTENTEATFVSQLDTFIRQAEERILHEVQLTVFRKAQAGALTAGNQYLGAPSDYLSAFSLAIVNGTDQQFLLHKDVNFIRETFPVAATTGVPRFYAEFDNDTFIVGPTPTLGHVVELHYFYEPASIVTSTTSWLGTNAESALLYGCLIEAYTFMKGEADMLELYFKRYAHAVQLLKNLGEGKNRQDVYRSGQIRRAVA